MVGVTDSMNKNYSVQSILHRSTKILGVEFAPICIPLERRLQTCGILIWLLMAFVIPFSLYVFSVLLFSSTPIALLYLAWIYYDRETRNKGGRRFEWIRSWRAWNYYKDYFPLKLIKTADLDPKRNYLLGAHPHGICCNGLLGAFARHGENFNDLFPGMTPSLLTIDILFLLPFMREVFLAFGALPATKHSISYILSDPEGGRVGVLLPGGFREMLESRPNTNVVSLKSRKGFIKLALQNGSPLVPVYSFGETNAYEQLKFPDSSLIRRIQLACVKTVGFYPPIGYGRGIFQYTFGILPKRVPITTVVGAPIEVEKTIEPTQEQIDSLHEKFVTALKDLFYAHREESGYPKAELEII